MGKYKRLSSIERMDIICPVVEEKCLICQNEKS